MTEEIDMESSDKILLLKKKLFFSAYYPIDTTMKDTNTYFSFLQQPSNNILLFSKLGLIIWQRFVFPRSDHVLSNGRESPYAPRPAR